MKKTLVLSVILFYTFIAKSQDIPISFFETPRDTLISNSLTFGKPLHAQIINVSDNKKIVGWNYYPSVDGIFFQLENNQAFASNKKYSKDLVMVNPQTFSATWNKQVRNMDNSLVSNGDLLFLTLKKKTFLLDITDGKELWNIKKDLYYALPQEKIGLFYPFGNSSSKMTAINLKTGKPIWEADQPHRFGWDDAYLYDPTTLLIAGEGFKLYNIYNGQIFEYKAKTSYSDASQKFWGNMLLAVTTGVVSGLLGGDVSVYSGDYNVNTSSNIMSNVSIDAEGNFYLASIDRITCLSGKGKIVWTNKLPKNKTAKSTLFLSNGKVYLLNRGYAFSNGRPTLMGEAFLAAYDVETGEQRFFETLSSSNEPIDNFQVIGNTLYAIMNESIRSYDLENGQLVDALIMPTENASSGMRFVEEGIYVKNANGNFVDILDENPSSIHVLNGDNTVFSMDENLSVTKNYNQNDVYSLTMKENGTLFLEQGNNTFIVRNGVLTTVLPFKMDGFISSDNKFYQINNKEILELDLNGLE